MLKQPSTGLNTLLNPTCFTEKARISTEYVKVIPLSHSSTVNNSSMAVVLKVVDIDPQGSIGPSKGSLNNHRVEWGSLNSQGVNE